MASTGAPAWSLLRFSASAGFHSLLRVEKALERVPQLSGRPVRVLLMPDPHAHRGRLSSGRTRGTAVHAGTFLRRRRIVLDAELLEKPRELPRILTHEIFHFVWVRLGNGRRRAFEALLEAEVRKRAPGELGWSAEWRKRELSRTDWRDRTRRWREYVCESFCDTAGWLYSGIGRHGEFTLPGAYRRKRRQWFCDAGGVFRI